MYLCIVCIRISCFWPSKNTHIKNLCKIQRCHTAALAIPHYFSTSDVKPAWSKLGCFLPTGQRQGRHAVGDPHGDEKQRPSDLATFGGEDDAGRDRTAEWHGRPGWWLPRGVDRQSYASLMELMGTSPACPSFKNRTCLHPDFSGLCQGSNSCNELILQGDAIARDEDENPRSSSNRISFRRSMLNRAAESTPGSPYKSGTGPKA